MAYFDEKDSVLNILHQFIKNIESISVSVVKNKRLNIVDLGEIKNKHGRLTMQVLIKELQPSKYEKLSNFINGLKEELIPKLRTDGNKMDDKSNNQKLLAFRKTTFDTKKLHEYLNDLPTDLSNLSHIVLDDRERVSRGRASLVEATFTGFCLLKPDLDTSIKAHIIHYEILLNRVLEQTNELLTQEIDLNIKGIKMNIIQIFKKHIISIKNQTEEINAKDYSSHITKKLIDLKKYYESDIHKFEEYRKEFEKHTPIPKPKKPMVFNTQKYKDQLKQWEEQIGKKRISYEMNLRSHLQIYFRLRELKLQWEQLREYYSKLLGKDDPLARFYLK